MQRAKQLYSSCTHTMPLDAKKTNYCPLGKLYLWCTSLNVILTNPQKISSRTNSTSVIFEFCQKFSQETSFASQPESTSMTAKSTSPGLLDFFACCVPIMLLYRIIVIFKSYTPRLKRKNLEKWTTKISPH